MSRHREPSPASRICFAKEERRESSTTASPARQGGAFLATDEGTRVPLRKAPQGGASSGTSSQARAQSSAGMAELGRRKGKAPWSPRLGPGQGWDSQSQATRRMRFQQHSDCKIPLP